MTRAMTLWRALPQSPLPRAQPDRGGVNVLIDLTPDTKYVFLERPRHRAQTAHSAQDQVGPKLPENDSLKQRRSSLIIP